MLLRGFYSETITRFPNELFLRFQTHNITDLPSVHQRRSYHPLRATVMHGYCPQRTTAPAAEVLLLHVSALRLFDDVFADQALGIIHADLSGVAPQNLH